MFKNKMFIAMIIAIVCISALSLSGCKKDEIVSNSSNSVLSSSDLAISDPEIKKEIEFMRDKKIISKETYQKWLTAPKSQIIDEVDVVINASGDIRHDEEYRIPPYFPHAMYDEELLNRRVIQELIKEASAPTTKGMKRAPYMFGSTGGTITCRVFTQSGNGRSAVTQEWKTALNQAIATWNALGLNVQFQVVNATNTNIVGGYVNVYMANRNNGNVFVSATSPNTAGYFGQNLIINTHPNTAADVNGKKTALIHELGHILGFKHTDEFADNVDIFNTAVSCNEYYLSDSFMYGGMTYNQIFAGFSACDLQNLNYYW